MDLIKTRRSIRKYKIDMPEDDLINNVISAGIMAPSSLNRQPWRFVVVKTSENRETIINEAKNELGNFLKTDDAKIRWGDKIEHFKARATDEGDTIFYNAPVIIFIIQTVDLGNTFDHGLASQNMMIAAHGLGLGTCPIGLAKPLENSSIARKVLELKPEENIILGLCLGYPDQTSPVKERNFDVVTYI